MRKRAIVTGGSSGLGYAIAKELLSNNIDVVITGRHEGKLIKATHSLNSHSLSYSAFNLANESSVQSFFAELTTPVDYLFNVAGTGIFKEVTHTQKKDIDTVLEANLIGLILMTTHYLKKHESHGGKLINVMSTAAQVGKKNEAIYCASKWGARGFTEALKTTYKGSNISILGVYPGGMETAFWSEDGRDTSSFMNPMDVAQQIVLSATHEKAINVTDLIIERL